MSFMGLERIPVKFSRVERSFFCNNNNLTTLENSPKIVYDNFGCYNNNLKTLEGCPSKIGGYLICYNNPIQTYEHIAEIKFDNTSFVQCGYHVNPPFDELYSYDAAEIQEIYKYRSPQRVIHLTPKKDLYMMSSLIKAKY